MGVQGWVVILLGLGALGVEIALILRALTLSHLKGTMIFDKAINGLITTTHANDDLVILNLNEELLSSVCVDTLLLLSHKEQAGFAMTTTVSIDEFSQFTVSWIVPDWLIYKVDPLKIIHVVMYPLKLTFTLLNLTKEFLVLFDDGFQMCLRVFIPCFHQLKLLMDDCIAMIERGLSFLQGFNL